MKPFSQRGRPLSRAMARNAALLNQLATPGLGSLVGRRWIAGAGQLLIFLLGFILFCIWNFNTVATYYQLAFSDTPPPADRWGNAGWLGVVLCVTAWLWAAVTSFSLLREATTGRRQALENFGAPPPLKLAESKILPALATVPQWHLQDTTITRTFEFKDFPAAIKFVDLVAALAEQAWHHPDINIRWNKVTLTLTTHDAGGLTEKDFALARQFDKL
ncbi:MAG: 4a-hydroxytetrahydrobiopterin dehydratase [Limisphaerales bacterium]